LKWLQATLILSLIRAPDLDRVAVDSKYVVGGGFRSPMRRTLPIILVVSMMTIALPLSNAGPLDGAMNEADGIRELVTRGPDFGDVPIAGTYIDHATGLLWDYDGETVSPNGGDDDPSRWWSIAFYSKGEYMTPLGVNHFGWGAYNPASVECAHDWCARIEYYGLGEHVVAFRARWFDTGNPCQPQVHCPDGAMNHVWQTPPGSPVTWLDKIVHGNSQPEGRGVIEYEFIVDGVLYRCCFREY